MKKILALLLVIMLLLTAGVVWVLMSFHIIDGQLYPRNADFLNLQNKNISISHYESLAQRLPGCEILWNVPFQGEYHSSTAEELVLKDLETDLDHLAYFPHLKTLDARNCADLSSLGVLRQLHPEVTVLAEIALGGKTCSWDEEQIELSAITAEELELLPCLMNLKQVTVGEGGDAANFPALKEYCESNGIDFRVIVFGSVMEKDVAEISISNVSDNQLQLLSLCPWMKKIHLPEPEAAAEILLAMKQAMPDTEVTWEKTVLGKTFRQDVKEIDLTAVIALADGEMPGTKTAWEYGLEYPVMGDREKEPTTAKVLRNRPFPDKTDRTEQLIAEVEASMEYFPEVEKLEMCGAWLDNEAMAQFRERHREDYKVVWTVLCGDIAPQTDTTFFMPTKYGAQSGGFNELYSENLKYCEEIVSMDIGHMQVVTIDFLRYMPQLKYLVLFSQPVYDLSPLAECKNLVYLELSMCTWISDYTPLQGCTALEDLNIERSSGDISPIFEMTWLKNLWIGDRSAETCREARESLPDTNVVSGTNPTSRWRSLPNYYKMRDALLMFYMQ